MRKIFISYRREDTAPYAGRLYDRLKTAFGDDRLFMDIDHIEPGEDFFEIIQARVAESDILVALIGRSWLSATDADGKRRIDDPEDFVRYELRTALTSPTTRVIPVLVGGAAMPRMQQLPEEIARLSRRNAFEVSDLRFHQDVDRLIDALNDGVDVDHRSLRSAPTVLSDKELATALVTHSFYDKRMNPAGKGVTHDYAPLVVGDAVVLIDRATGLMWQRDGSERAVTFSSAEESVRRMNVEKVAGFTDWRLPTMEEVGSLMEPQAHDELHISPAFRRGVNFIWTADRHPNERIWMAYFVDAQFACEKPDFNAWVRAVRSNVETTSGS
jgi:uncharacterized protein DUF1566/TIR domain-containing protein